MMMAGDGASSPRLELLRILVEGIEAKTGESFFDALVEHLARALGVQYVFVSQLTRGGSHFRTLALWVRGAPAPNLEVPLEGTPCEAVLNGQAAHHPDRLQQLFPADVGLVDWNAVSYGGVPMLNSQGQVVGHFAFMDDRPMADGSQALYVMRLFAARAVAEIERKGVEEALRASQTQLASVIDRASDGIVVYDETGNLLVVNRGAERILRCKAADVLGTSVFQFATPEGGAVVQAAFERLSVDPDALIFAGVEQGLTARRADGTIFVQAASLSQSRVDGRILYTVIFRDADESVEAARDFESLRRQTDYLREEIQAAHNFEEIVGRSSALRKVLGDVELVAATDATAMIHGETGTGKELVARAIHARSPRRDRPLIKINCAALSPGLVESELFGHERGAFTGAADRRIGRFELAEGGTLFLDEAGEIPLETQAKLLRVLQEREFERVGGTRTIRVDVRVIAATNRDLSRAVAEGRFRQDLFYRLNVFPLTMPPLRERIEDVPLLAQYFAVRHGARMGRRIERISDDTLARLRAYPWPGNVRELENVIERAVILSRGPVLEVGAGLLDAGLVGGAPPSTSVTAPGRGSEAGTNSGAAPLPPAASLEDAERRHILAALHATGWRIEGALGASSRLGLTPSTLRSRIKKLGIERPRDASA